MELERIKTKEVLQGFFALKVMLSDINVAIFLYDVPIFTYSEFILGADCETEAEKETDCPAHLVSQVELADI